MVKLKFPAKIYRLGGSKAVTIPKAISYNLDPNQEYEIVLMPVGKRKQKEEAKV